MYLFYSIFYLSFVFYIRNLRIHFRMILNDNIFSLYWNFEKYIVILNQFFATKFDFVSMKILILTNATSH